MRNWRFIILFLFLAFTANVFAQAETDQPSISIESAQQEKLNQINKELDYSATEMRWQMKEREKKKNDEEKIKPFKPRSFGNFNGAFANSLAYLLIIILIMAVIFMIFANIKRNKTIEAAEKNDDDYIEDIEVIDTIDGFKQALNAGDYRSAIRMQFIKVLQLLQENNHINWKPEKTNKDYIRELSDTDQKNPFRKLSGFYELVWYGNTKIDRESFEQINPFFDHFINGFDGK